MNNYLNYIKHSEKKISLYCNQLAINNKFIFYFFRIITIAADWWMYFIYAIFLLLYIEFNTTKNIIILGSVSFSIHYSLYYLIKNTIKRKRPFDEEKNTIKCLVKPPDKYSMPSGHSSGITIITLILIYQLKINIFLFVAPFVILSRIFLGVHYLTDTIIGILLGYISYNLASFIIG